MDIIAQIINILSAGPTAISKIPEKISGNISEGISVVKSAGNNLTSIINNSSDNVTSIINNSINKTELLLQDTEQNVTKIINNTIDTIGQTSQFLAREASTDYLSTLKSGTAVVDDQLDKFQNTADKFLVNMYDIIFYNSTLVFIFGTTVFYIYGNRILKIGENFSNPLGKILEKVAEKGGIKIDI